jgi:hypothetical protein
MQEIQQRIKDMNRLNRIIPRDPLLELDNNLINEIGKELETVYARWEELEARR